MEKLICPNCNKSNFIEWDGFEIDDATIYCAECDIEYRTHLIPDLKNARRIYNWSKTKEGQIDNESI